MSIHLLSNCWHCMLLLAGLSWMQVCLPCCAVTSISLVQCAVDTSSAVTVGCCAVQVMHWSVPAMQELIQKDYVWFWVTFKALPDPSAQAAAARLLILHRHGGLSITPDCECYRTLDKTLGDFDVVFQVGYLKCSRPSEPDSYRPCCTMCY